MAKVQNASLFLVRIAVRRNEGVSTQALSRTMLCTMLALRQNIRDRDRPPTAIAQLQHQFTLFIDGLEGAIQRRRCRIQLDRLTDSVRAAQPRPAHGVEAPP